MPKILFKILALTIFLLLPKVVFADSLSFTVSPLPPTEQSNLTINYAGLTNENDCLVIYFKKDTSYLKFAGSKLNPSCFTDSNTYDSFLASGVKGTYGFEPQPPGNYELLIKDYKESCNIDFLGKKAGCGWVIQKTSNIISFTVIPLQSNYSANFIINPSAGKATDKFVAESLVIMRSDGSPVPKTAITIDIPNSGGRIIGQGITDNTGKSSIDISSRIIDLSANSYNIRAKFLLPNNETVTTNTQLIITQDKNGKTLSRVVLPTCKSLDDPTFDKTKDVACSSSAGIFCDNNTGIATAIGCIHTQPQAFIQDLMKFILGIGGGIAFLLMLFGVFEMITSAGNPERLKSGTNRFTSAIVGILLIVFSILFMQVIGVDILGILPK